MIYKHISRQRLFVIWGLWLTALISFSILFILGLPEYYQYCVNLSSAFFQEMPGWVEFVMYYMMGWEIVPTIPFCLTAFVIVWQKPDDWFAVFVATTLIAFGGGFSVYHMHMPELYEDVFTPPINYYVVRLPEAFSISFSVMILFLFPSGSFAPRWTRWLVLGWTCWILAGVFIPVLYVENLPYGTSIAVYLVIYGAGIAAQTYRYRHISTSLERQQTKWLLWSCLLGLLGYTISSTVWMFVPFDPSLLNASAYLLIAYPFRYGPHILVALSFGFAILRHRLWDIDIFINRSLVYGGLTILLGSLLVGVFTLAQGLLSVMVKDMQAGVAGIVSVIIVIALFLPARDRLQRFVDSRVYGVDPNHERAVQEAIAQERDRLSQELHDSVTQSLYGLTIMAESCQRLVRDEDAREPLIEMGDVARQALKEMRLLIHELRPPILEEEGLLSALHQRLAVVERRSGIEANLVIEEVVDLPVVMEEALYHIAIEALNNAIKHAAATSVSLSLRTGDAWVELEIADNGKGFDLDSDSGKGGMGLAGMRKRAEELDGTLTVYSVPGQGTKVIARVVYHTDHRRYEAKAVS